MIDLTPFEELDRVIHVRGRLAIVSLLAATDRIAFTELRAHLGMTDGNLSVHMRTLEEAGYVMVHRSFVGRKPRSEYALTPAGRAVFQRYIQALEAIVRESHQAEERFREDHEAHDNLSVPVPHVVLQPG